MNDEIESHNFHQIPNTQTIVCLVTMKAGNKVVGVAIGPREGQEFSFAAGCNVAYKDALRRIDPVGFTEDMRLPDGSAVFQIILNTKNGQPNIDMRGVLIGATEYDPANPAHRICGVIQNRMSEIVAEATGGEIVQETTDAIEARLRVDPATITPNGNPVDPYLGELDPDRSLPVPVEDDGAPQDPD